MSLERELLQTLEENSQSLDIHTIDRLYREGYIKAKILHNNDKSLSYASYAGLTEKGKRELAY